MTGQTTHADRAAERVAAFLDVWDAAPVQRTAPRDAISTQRAGSASLRASDLRALLAERDQQRVLVRDAGTYLGALHVHVGHHDLLGENYTCAGCALQQRLTEETNRA